MKIAPVILALSLVLNLILAALGWKQFHLTHRFSTTATTAREPATDLSQLPSASIAASAVQTGKTPARAKTGALWANLQPDKLDGLADRLRAAGFSPSDQAAIILALIFEQSSETRALFMNSSMDRPYWKTQYAPRSNKDMKAIMNVYAEQQKLIHQYIINTDLYAANESYLEMIRMDYGQFPVEKLRGLSLIESDYQELRLKQIAERELRQGESRYDDAVDRERGRLLEQEKLADIKKLLTSEEFTQYEKRNSPTAARLRDQLDLFQPTEAEYVALFKLQKSFDEKMQDKSLSESLRKAEQELLQTQIADAIGVQRAADYQVAMEGKNNKLARLLIRLELPVSTVVTVNTLRDDLTQRAQTIRNNAQLTAEQRSSQLAALTQEAATKLTTTLGARGYEAYTDLKGDWIRDLEKPTTGKP